MPTPPPDPCGDLMAGALEHLACYLQTGRVRSGRRAAMLLARIAQAPEAGEAVRDQCQHLGDVIDDLLPRPAPAPARGPLRPPAGRPWLVWETLEEVA